MAEAMTLEEQGSIGKTFLEGLMGAFGLPATVEVRLLDEETVELAVDGDGPRDPRRPEGRDSAGPPRGDAHGCPGQVPLANGPDPRRRRPIPRARAKALTEFTGTVAAEVLDTGEERRLEPMSPADRKVVHDAATEIDGVATRSEGEDPDRYVVISPA